MKLYFSDSLNPTELTKSIFLAGPSPRSKDIHDWRHDALAILETLDFKGEVFIPIPEKRFYGGDDSKDWTYLNQVKWECESRNFADIIFFWVPRDIQNGMPGFTTNVEFGEDLHSGKIIYGRPDNADKCRYLDQRYEELGKSVSNDLKEALEGIVTQLGEGSLRTQQDIQIPIHIWNTALFSNWYKELKNKNFKLTALKIANQKFSSILEPLYISLEISLWNTQTQQSIDNEYVVLRASPSAI